MAGDPNFFLRKFVQFYFVFQRIEKKLGVYVQIYLTSL